VSGAARLFLALWPDAPVQAALGGVQQVVVPAGVRAVPVHKQHLTLAFLGPTAAGVRGRLEQALDGVRAASFELCLDTIGGWPRTQVLWIAPGRPPAALAALQAAIAGCAEACGLVLDRRPFRPHLTLARRARAPRRRHCDPIRWQVRDFHLVQSLTDPNGARYQTLRQWPLDAPQV